MIFLNRDKNIAYFYLSNKLKVPYVYIPIITNFSGSSNKQDLDANLQDDSIFR